MSCVSSSGVESAQQKLRKLTESCEAHLNCVEVGQVPNEAFCAKLDFEA